LILHSRNRGGDSVAAPLFSSAGSSASAIHAPAASLATDRFCLAFSRQR
jgi:hypothetical protein